MKNSGDKVLYILDGHALVFRAHYAFINRPLINSKGLNTSAITGFVRSLWDIIVHRQPTHLAVSFDVSNVTFRNELYPEYKANRDATPEDIRIAFPYIKDIVDAFNIPILSLDNYEADDVIGTISKQAEKEGFQVYMVTPDKDFGQLVSENIKIFKPSRQGNGVEIMGIQEVLDKWDINRVDQVIDMIGLQGDSVDNIPGIPGVGPKTAAKLLKEYDTVENLLQSTDQLKGKLKQNLENFAEQGLLSKKLAVIDINAPIEFNAEATKIQNANKSKLSKLFAELEFRTLANSVLGEQPAGVQQALFNETTAPKVSASPIMHTMAPNDISNTEHQYDLVSADEISSLLEVLNKATIVCFDTETTSVNAMEAEMVGLSFCVESNKAYYVSAPVGFKACQAFLAAFKPMFENKAISKIGQNIKYDLLILKKYGIEVEGVLLDTMVMHYLVHPELRHNMDFLAQTYLAYDTISYDELTEKKGRKQLKLRDVDINKLTDYAAEDADITFQLEEKIRPELEESGMLKLYMDIEQPLIQVLAQMEYNGIRLDGPFLNEYSKKLNIEILQTEEAIYKAAEAQFNIGSPKQVGEILFDKLSIPYRWKKTKTGQYSTDEDKLSELAVEHDIVNKILEYRGLAKLKSTYVDALPKLINKQTGRIHSSFNQALAATGRLSSNNPNLQNIPIKTEAGRKVRQAFIPQNKDYVLLAADYSQIELRLIAHMSNDEAMLEAFQNNLDIHRATAAKVYEVPYEEVTATQRRNAKTVNFSIIYGAGATNLSRQLGIKRTEATSLINAYFNQYQGLKTYMDKTVEFAREHGYVETLLGRKRTLRDINSKNGMAKSGAERVAINTPIQGTAADMIKIAMINIHAEMGRLNLKSKLVLQVHDELVFDVYKPELETLQAMVIEKMKSAIPDLNVPILVEAGIGENWLQAH
ncbi:DNA polymerase I [Membranihabitans marinus]|uniref:DNA polymerase I n=1 Tax=Membranihabitans marinus TaxID=1227546 RepID=UPI001EFFF3E4|nr:DNA polymerase I [Membranihabitans marinus]